MGALFKAMLLLALKISYNGDRIYSSYNSIARA